MNEPVPDGDSGFASGCGTSLPQDKMDGFAGSLGERLRAAWGGGRDETGRHGRDGASLAPGGGAGDRGRAPAAGPGAVDGSAGLRAAPARAGAGGDAELSAQRHPLCGGRGGKLGGRERERERRREGGDASAKSGQLQTICCESSGCTCLLCSFLAVGLRFPGVTYLGLAGSFCLMPF